MLDSIENKIIFLKNSDIMVFDSFYAPIVPLFPQMEIRKFHLNRFE